jgi:hypothetical protein
VHRVQRLASSTIRRLQQSLRSLASPPSVFSFSQFLFCLWNRYTVETKSSPFIRLQNRSEPTLSVEASPNAFHGAGEQQRRFCEDPEHFVTVLECCTKPPAPQRVLVGGWRFALSRGRTRLTSRPRRGGRS